MCQLYVYLSLKLTKNNVLDWANQCAEDDFADVSDTVPPNLEHHLIIHDFCLSALSDSAQELQDSQRSSQKG